ncbi:MAG: hypothetical protein H0U85_02835 [Gemmatimonadales bacterium]|nr:hypothetical protein [Gemmatimonadales bacterium]
MTAHALRPLSVGEILDVSFALYREHFATLAAIVAVSSGLPLLMNVYIGASGGWTRHMGVLPLYFILTVVLGSIGAAATVYVVSESYLGRSVTAGDSLTRAVPLIGRLVVYSLLFALIVALGTILLIVPGVILACGMMLATPALVLEAPLSATGALRRSWNLTRGARGRMFALALVFLVLIYIPIAGTVFVLSIVGGGLAALAGGEASTTTVVVSAVAGIVQMLIYPFLYCVITVAYYDLRVRKEGFDLEVLASTLHAA